MYDTHGLEGMANGRGDQMDPAAFFSQFFGGGHTNPMFDFDFGPDMNGRRRGKGDDSIIPYEVTLEDLYNGKSVKMNMEKEVVCTVCKGYATLFRFPGTRSVPSAFPIGLEREVMLSRNLAPHVKAKVGR